MFEADGDEKCMSDLNAWARGGDLDLTFVDLVMDAESLGRETDLAGLTRC